MGQQLQTQLEALPQSTALEAEAASFDSSSKVSIVLRHPVAMVARHVPASRTLHLYKAAMQKFMDPTCS